MVFQIKPLDSVHEHILCTPIFESVILLNTQCGAAVLPWVEVLGYEPEGRVLDFRWCQWNFSFT